MQISIFSELTELSGEIWEQLRNHDFVAAAKGVSDALAKYPGEEVLELQRCRAADWMLLSHTALSATELLQRIAGYPFTDEWGDKELRQSLLKRVANVCENNRQFQLGATHDLADVYLLLDDSPAAERALEVYLAEHGNCCDKQLKLANIQRSMNKISFSNLLYMQVFFSFADNLGIEKVQHPLLKELASTHTVPMCIPWSVVHGEQMPLAAAAEFTDHASPEVRKAARACVAMAENILAREQKRTTLSARKALADCDRQLFYAFMNV